MKWLAVVMAVLIAIFDPMLALAAVGVVAAVAVIALVAEIGIGRNP